MLELTPEEERSILETRAERAHSGSWWLTPDGRAELHELFDDSPDGPVAQLLNELERLESKQVKQPLLYIQVGVRLICPDDSATWWEVREICEDYSRSSDQPPLAVLTSNDLRTIVRDEMELRAHWSIYPERKRA